MTNLFEYQIICTRCKASDKLFTDDIMYAGKLYHPCNCKEYKGNEEYISDIVLKVEFVDEVKNVKSYWNKLLNDKLNVYSEVTETFFIDYTEEGEIEVITPHRIIKAKVYTG